MRTGKVKESILKRSVLRQLHNDSILTPGKTGADHTRSVWAAEGSHRAGVPTLLINPVEGWTLAAERAVYGAVNSYAAAGLELRAIAVTILMPEGTEESQLKALIKNLDRLCRDQGIVIASGHTAVSPAVNTLVLSVAGIGQRQPAAGMGQRQSAAGIGQRQSEAGYERTEIEGQGPAAGN
ncbi:MAG: hypothetical protein IJ137_05860, partial [Eubacterium sp.]|nr:hypothetical protein [Eubacterium sp.]